jgi:hypothetical protein
LIQLAFAFGDAQFLHLIDDGQQLSLQTHKPRAGLADASVFVGDLFEVFQVLGGGRDGLWFLASAIGEHGGGVQLAPGATAALLSTASPEDVERSGEQRQSALEIVEQLRDFLLGALELAAELAELVVHCFGLSWCIVPPFLNAIT